MGAYQPIDHNQLGLLGYQDSNLEQLNQNQSCCQLHHTPWRIAFVFRETFGRGDIEEL